MGGTRSTYGERRDVYRVLVRGPGERAYLEDSKWDGAVWTGSIWFRIGTSGWLL